MLAAAIRERRPLVMQDIQAEAPNPLVREYARLRGNKSVVGVPMLRGDDVLGVIVVSSRIRKPAPSGPSTSSFSRRSPRRRSSRSRTCGSSPRSRKRTVP
jgi:GAF domain-containing protein